MRVASLRKSVRRELPHAEITYTHTYTEGRYLSLQTQCMQNNTYLEDVCVIRCLQEARLCEVWAVWYSVKQSIKDTMSRLFSYFIKACKNF